jgi:hypothetical protein
MTSSTAFARSLNSLVGIRPKMNEGKLPSAPRSPDIAESTGIAYLPNVGEGGLTPPFTENDANARTYWPKQTVTSTDGSVEVDFYPIKTVVMVDTAGVEVLLEFAEPDLNALP